MNILAKDQTFYNKNSNELILGVVDLCISENLLVNTVYTNQVFTCIYNQKYTHT